MLQIAPTFCIPAPLMMPAMEHLLRQRERERETAVKIRRSLKLYNVIFFISVLNSGREGVPASCVNMSHQRDLLVLHQGRGTEHRRGGLPSPFF